MNIKEVMSFKGYTASKGQLRGEGSEVVADEAYFVEGKAANSGAQADQAPAPTSQPANLEPLNTDDDLPF